MVNNKVHVAVFASPGMGHIIPMIELSRKLVLNHLNCSATIIIPSLGPPPPAQIQLLKTLPPAVTHVLLPPVDPDTLSHISTDAKLFLTVDRSMTHLRDTIGSLSEKFPVAALIADIFALTLALCSYMPKLDAEVAGDYREMTEPIRLPGCRFAFPVADLHPSILDRNSDAYQLLLRHSKRQRLADGFIVNSFMEAEGEIIQALRGDELADGRPIFPIGPILQSNTNSTGTKQSECLEWLDNQPTSSVLFVSFGSGGTLSPEQLNELALGLESSGQRFLWVVRSPNTTSDTNASYIGPQSNSNPLTFLPQGFLDRTKGRGLAVAWWAPQIEVLSHRATGGFLNHCGWNSTMESIVNGVPLIAWPLHGDQKMVAVQLVEFLKDLIEGEQGAAVRTRMSELKEAALNAVSEDGYSSKSLQELVLLWRRIPVA
ncbi:Hydroquinone glucosyltransferase [Linum perenne]